MLDISYEVRKGILFIRLEGELTKDTSKKIKEEITDMIEDNGIKNVVFNIEGLSKVDEMGIQSLQENFDICKENQGSAFLCGIDRKKKGEILLNKITNDVTWIDNELSAFYKITV